MRLHAQGVRVTRAGRLILDGVDLELRPGQLTCLVGPNGAGKSSLLRVLMGLWEPEAGTVLLGDRSLHEHTRREIARRVAFVPQETQLSMEFTVTEVVAMGRYPHEGRFAGPSAHPAAADALVRADVSHLAERLVTTLSGGERQRVLLARCLAAEAGTLLLDEPTASLDLRHAMELMQLCRALAQEGRAVCVAIHDLNAALRFAHHIAVMEGGRIVRAGPPADALTPALIEEVFGVRSEFLRDAAGEPVLRFRPRARVEGPGST